MKKTWKVLSYVLVAALSVALTLGATSLSRWTREVTQTSKLDQLEDLLEERFIGETDRTAMEDAAAAAMVDSLGDRWSYYIPAAEYGAYKDQMNNSYVGIGVTIQVTEDNSGFLITKVTEGGPAEEAGLLAGDRIIAADGQDVTALDVNETKRLVVGDEGTFVDITVNRDGQKLTMQVERRTIKTVVASGVMLEKNVGLVTIVNFDARCSEETIAAIEELLAQGATSLIFDVRNNPGGYANELVKVLDYLLPEGELFRTVDYQGNEDVDMSDARCLEGVPFAVLVNSESYSAAEFFAAAMREYDAAVVVGDKTVGKGYFQVTYQLRDGSAVGLSIGKYFTPKGVSLAEAGGLVPDILVEVDDETFAAIYAATLEPEKDPQVQAAVDALTK